MCMDTANHLIFMFNDGAFFHFVFFAKHHHVAALISPRAACSQEPLCCVYGKQVAALVSRFVVVSGPLHTTVAQLTASVYSQRGSSSPAS